MAASVSRYLEHLPALFQEDPFVGQFLLAFERILSGLPRADPANILPVPPGLEQILDSIETFFDPMLTPADPGRDFLSWLAGWVATSLREDWDVATRRRFVANIVPLYRRRGTRKALQKLLQIYLNPNDDPQRDSNQDVEVLESPKPGDVDQTEFPPRYFQVRFTVLERDPALLARRAAIAAYIIDREKPAHTFYGLRISYASLQLSTTPSVGPDGKPDYQRGVFVGKNTVLGGAVFKPSLEK